MFFKKIVFKGLCFFLEGRGSPWWNHRAGLKEPEPLGGSWSLDKLTDSRPTLELEWPKNRYLNSGRFLTNQVCEQLIHPTFREGWGLRGRGTAARVTPTRPRTLGPVLAGRPRTQRVGPGEATGALDRGCPRMQLEHHRGESVGWDARPP